MASFHFSLQQVLRYREQLKEQAQVEHARVQTELTREMERARQLEILIAESQAKQYALPPGEHGERWLLDHFIKGLREDFTSTVLRIRTLSAELEKTQQALALRAKEHKILEKLKSKQAERHAHEERINEQRTYDETASIRFKASTF